MFWSRRDQIPSQSPTRNRSRSILSITGLIVVPLLVALLLGVVLRSPTPDLVPTQDSTEAGARSELAGRYRSWMRSILDLRAVAESSTVGFLWNKISTTSGKRVSSISSSPSHSIATSAPGTTSENTGMATLASTATANGSAVGGADKKKTPVYFVSHGGPNLMYDHQHPAYAQLQAIGREITTTVRPRAIVAFSAHWQAERPGVIEVNVSEREPLIYDFYGFPRHYYSEKFENRGSEELARRVMEVLGESGIRTVGVERGLDHGVFVPFKVMFDSGASEKPDVPIVQVSLFEDDTDAEAHIKLGRAVSKLREEGVLIVASGMAVHNLRHWMMMGTGRTMPYAVSFDAALKEAVEATPGAGRDKAMVALLERPDARQAHPTFEHLIPVHVALGAAGDDQGSQLWTMPEGSMSWAQFRFGELEAEA